MEGLWKVKFRLRTLARTSADQLFFLYYALDNCEQSDEPYKSHQYRTWRRLPPEQQVNFPLRHTPQFWEAFNCGPGTALRAPGDAICKVCTQFTAK